MCPPETSKSHDVPLIPSSADDNTLPFSLRPATPAIDVRELFEFAFKKNASDIHLTEHTPPLLRIDGSLERTAMPALSRADTKRIV